MSFIEGIKEKAKQDLKTIVLPETEDERTIRAAAKVAEEKTAKLILLGNADTVKADAAKYGVSLDGVTVVDPEKAEKLDAYVALLTELRAKKGMTPELARETLLKDKTMFGVIMVKNGDADGLVSGACHSTANTLRPALQILKTAPGKKLASGFFVLDVPNCQYGENGTFVFADCALNQDPDSEQLAAIASDSAESFEALVGKHARVAFLSHSTKGSAKHALVDKVVGAVTAAKSEYPSLDCDGELQLDAALDPTVAALKAPGSTVAGKANVLIFPNIDAGNIGYKLVQRLGKAEAYGPMLQGLAAPVNDLSRGCFWEDIVGVVALTAVQAQLAAKK
ncbi:MAG: phosphate acetyltransferase [Erysipelotrichaceae bacterium]|jgi:phosphate acetyltransferase|nr:phosphate acetyltransferase [Erysipelotrichaceae bacterium]